MSAAVALGPGLSPSRPPRRGPALAPRPGPAPRPVLHTLLPGPRPLRSRLGDRFFLNDGDNNNHVFVLSAFGLLSDRFCIFGQTPP